LTKKKDQELLRKISLLLKAKKKRPPELDLYKLKKAQTKKSA